jgi:hypothetical protein
MLKGAMSGAVQLEVRPVVPTDVDSSHRDVVLGDDSLSLLAQDRHQTLTDL